MAPAVSRNPEQIELQLGGRSFTAWESLSIERAIDRAAGSFRVVVSGDQSWPVAPSTPIAITCFGRAVFTGRVDSTNVDWGPTTHRITLSGRDLTSDLVDSSAVNDPGEIGGIRAGQVIKWLAFPFRIEVVERFLSPKPIERFAIRPGESAWAAIDRAARMGGFLAYPDGRGALFLDRASGNDSIATLLSGPKGNVLSASVRNTHADRFQVYRVVGQHAGTDFFAGAAVAGVLGTATDGEIQRYRPLVVLAEGQVTPELAEERAQWEATWRAANSSEIQIVTQGWTPRVGIDRTWEINTRTHVRIPELEIDSPMLIKALQFSSGASGNLTTLVLVRPDAYAPKPEVDPFAALLGLEGDD